MARKLASAVALITMAVSATALALGLGDIQTGSALNQAFEAEVELLSVDPAELDGVRVRLAPPEAFQRAGVDRPFFLSGLKFTPQLNAAGKTVVRVHSDKPIREPFLNFLVEVQWPKGKLVREYTVLLDPPTTLDRRPAPVARPQSAAPAAISAPSEVPRTAAPSASAVMPDEYGPVQDSETLWGISRKLRPDGASLAQTLMALYKANPNAFARGDINRLQKGRILRVPNRDEVFALSRREAEVAYRAELDAAMASRTQPAASAAPADDMAAAADSGSATAASGGTAAPSGEASELRIATPRPEGEGVAGAGDDAATEAATAEDLKNALMLARENAETSRLATDNLRTEVSTLEQQLADMQRLLSLKDDQLAQLQANVQEGGQQPAADGMPVEAGAGAGAGAEAGAEADAAAAMDSAVEPAADAMPDADASADTDSVTTPLQASDSVAADMTGADQEAEAPVAAEPPVQEEAAATPAEAEPAAEMEVPAATSGMQGLLDRLMSNTGLLAGAAAAVLALLLGLLLFLRRRKPEADDEDVSELVEDDLDESILMEPSEDDALDMDAADAAPAGNDTSFLSEFSASDMHSLADETSEVDPVSEADVYIAYGRYDQAEDLLSQALSREPERMALKFKLLEVYYANRNIAAFTACAQELADAGQDGVDTGAWQRVCDMGRDLAPDYPLFSADAVAMQDESLPNFEPSEPVGIDPLSAFNEESILNIPSLDEGKAGDQGTVDAPSEHVAENELDLTLDLDDLSMPHSISQDDESLEGLESIELELPDLDKDPAKKSIASDVSDDSLILDLDTSLEDSLVDAGQEQGADEGLDAESLQAQLEELSDLTDLDDELSQLTADFESLSEPAPAAEPEVLAMPEDAGMDLDVPPPFAAQMAEEDEVQTKLDLAIAYVEMGDKDGARSILDEVRAEGSSDQQAEAEKLLADINA